MAWQDNLNEREQIRLKRAEEKRDAAREAYNNLRFRLKNRAESRMRIRKTPKRKNAGSTKTS